MPRKTGNNSNNHNPCKRRSKWAADLEHLIPGGKQMSDSQLEVAVLQMLGKFNR